MADYWMIPRAKRTLTSLPLVLTIMSKICLDRPWDQEVTLELESILEEKGLKKPGTRRDRRGGGGRTYRAWMEALGFIFKESSTGFYRLTKAGEALISAEVPLNQLVAYQLMKVQYPSPYSIATNVNIDRRFRVHPFRFILQLLLSKDIISLTTEEIALFVVTDGVSDRYQCIQSVRDRILTYRDKVANDSEWINTLLNDQFAERFKSRAGKRTPNKTFRSLKDIANTFINYIEYTQIASRDAFGCLRLNSREVAEEAVNSTGSFIRLDTDTEDMSMEIERFQRNFGLGRNDTRDNRSFTQGYVNGEDVSKKLVMMSVHDKARWSILNVTDDVLIKEIAQETGVEQDSVKRILAPLSGKELEITRSSYVSMAFAGRLEATNFEKATTALLGERGLGFDASHVGGPGNGNEPDVYIKERGMMVAGIIDTKAYSSYIITNDHKNRMLYNYISKYKEKDGFRLGFFMYIAGGFGKNFERQLSEMAEKVRIGAVGMTAEELLRLIRSTSISNDLKRERLIELSKQRKILTAAEIESMPTVSRNKDMTTS